MVTEHGSEFLRDAVHAVLQAKSQGNSDLIDRLEVRRRLMELQQRLVAELEASSSSVPVRTLAWPSNPKPFPQSCQNESATFLCICHFSLLLKIYLHGLCVRAKHGLCRQGSLVAHTCKSPTMSALREAVWILSASLQSAPAFVAGCYKLVVKGSSKS